MTTERDELADLLFEVAQGQAQNGLTTWERQADAILSSPWLRKRDAGRAHAGACVGWDAAVNAMRYEDGTTVEIVAMTNPYRDEVTTDE
jgi:hypothetical protein